MTFARFSGYLEKLEATSGRLEMTAILADLFKTAAVGEIDKVCYLSLGRLAPLYDPIKFDLAGKMMVRAMARAYGVSEERVTREFKQRGDLGEVAERFGQKAELKTQRWAVAEVYRRLRAIAEAGGSGSQERKVAGIAELLRSLDPLSARYAVRITLGTMRLGFSEITLLEGLSWLRRGDKSLKAEIEAVYRVYPDVGLIAAKLKKRGLPGIKGIKMAVGVPVLAARCQRAATAEEITDRLGEAVVEDKYDGTRVQLHLDRKRTQEVVGDQTGFFDEKERRPWVKTFTRNLEETTPMFPDLVRGAVDQVKAQSAILDGEAIGVDPKTGKYLPFQVTIKRKRKHGVGETAGEIPLKLIVFDLLYLDGKPLIKKPFAERRQLLERVIERENKGNDGDNVVRLASQTKVDDPQELLETFNDAIKRGLEGVVVKDLTAAYPVGARGYAWIKFKRQEGEKLEDTIDAVVLGYYRGTGKRTAFGIGAFLVGVYDEKIDGFKTIAKIGTGLTDVQWREMGGRCDEIRVGEKAKEAEVPKELTCDVWVKPQLVVAIRADEITKSPLHSAGYALRFPRLMAFRDDKPPQEATSLKEVLRLHKLQRPKS